MISSTLRGSTVAFAAALVLTGCTPEPVRPDRAAASLADGVTRAESLAIMDRLGRPKAAAMVSSTDGTCTLTWTAPGTVLGCSVGLPAVTPAVPWLQHSGQALDPGEIEQREPIHIAFAHTVRVVTLESEGALKCAGTHGRMVGFRDGVLVAQADIQLIDPSDCGDDDVTFGVRGQLPAEVGIDSLVIEGVNPWTFPVFDFCCGRALLKYTIRFSPAAEAEEVVIRSVSGSMEVRPARTGGTTFLDLEVGVYLAQTMPVPNRTVTLTVTPTEGTGGHDHQGGKPAGTLSPTVIETGAAGVARVRYTAPRVSGPVAITGTSSGARAAVDTIRVAVAGLQEIPRSGTHYTFQASDHHASGDFYMAPGAIEVMNQIWKQYVDSGFPVKSAKTFTITAATLVSGGLYDIRGNWDSPHSYHKQGGDIDFDDALAEASPEDMRKVCARFTFGGQSVECEVHRGTGVHFHAKLGPNR
jgi:hypothetical protein